MELDGTTIALQIINFLVLVWLLKRFLYQPILKVISARQQGIEQALRDAQAAESRAHSLREEYEQKLASLQHQHTITMDKLRDDVAAERIRRLDVLDKELVAERERQRVLDEKQAVETLRQLRRDANQSSTAFLARLLERLSGSELDHLLVRTVLEDLQNLSAEQANELRQAAAAVTEVQLTTARPLSTDDEQQLRQVLEGVTQNTLTWSLRTDSSLISGLHISLGAWRLSLSLADELEYFRNESVNDR